MTDQTPRPSRLRAGQPWYSIGVATLMAAIALNAFVSRQHDVWGVILFVLVVGLICTAVTCLIVALVKGRRAGRDT